MKIKHFLYYLKLLSKNKKVVKRRVDDWDYSITNPSEYYLDAFRYFHFFLPEVLRNHKNYFRQEARGFGEKALHTMWYLLYKKYNFKSFLEIGVYRGQVISLLSLLSQINKNEIIIYGISPFNNTGDAVSNYVEINYMDDVYKNFERFSLPPPILIKAFSTEETAFDSISSRLWDCIYIDGSHDYNIVKNDWLVCSTKVKVGGVIVIDDSSLYINYNPPFFAFRGHPGPSQVANEIDSAYFKEILRVGHNRVFEKIN